MATRITKWPAWHLLALALSACASDPAAAPDAGSSADVGESIDIKPDTFSEPDVPVETPDIVVPDDLDQAPDIAPLDVKDDIGVDTEAEDVALLDDVSDTTPNDDVVPLDDVAPLDDVVPLDDVAPLDDDADTTNDEDVAPPDDVADTTLDDDVAAPSDVAELDVVDIDDDVAPPDVGDVGEPDVEAVIDVDSPDFSESPDLSEPDVGPVPTPTLIEAGPTPDLAVQELLVLPTHAVGPRGPAVLAFTDDGAVLLEGAVKTPLGSSPVMPTFVEALSDELAVAAGPEGVWVLDGEASLESPVGAALDGAPITGLAVRPGASPTLWFAAGATLWRQQNGLLQPLDAPGFDATGATLAMDAGGGLWGAGPAGVFRVVTTVAGADIVWVRPDLVATDIAIDGLGRVWVVAEGDLHLHDAGVWSWLRLPSAVTAVDASPSVEAVWLVVGTDAWFMLSNQFLNIAALEGDAYVAVDAEGRGLLADSARLRRITVSPKEDLPPEVTWTEDIEPLFQAKCGQCHGAGQFASPKYTREAWIAQIDNILTFVSIGAMPLPPNLPLESADIQRIQAWKADGFPE